MKGDLRTSKFFGQVGEEKIAAHKLSKEQFYAKNQVGFLYISSTTNLVCYSRTYEDKQGPKEVMLKMPKNFSGKLLVAENICVFFKNGSENCWNFHV